MESTTDASIEITGATDEQARVVASGERAKVKGPRFTVTVPLDVGQNKIRLTAQVKGVEKTTETVKVKREEIVAEAPAPTTPPTETEPPYVSEDEAQRRSIEEGVTSGDPRVDPTSPRFRPDLYSECAPSFNQQSDGGCSPE